MNTMKFKNKNELITFVGSQINIILINDKNDLSNNKRNFLHTEIKQKNKLTVLSLLKKYGIYFESHINDYYFISVK